MLISEGLFTAEPKGNVQSQGQGHLVIGARRLQTKKWCFNQYASGLKTDATTINALELPAVSLGDVNASLKLDRGQLDLEELNTK